MPDTTGIQDEAVDLLKLDGTLPNIIKICPDDQGGVTETFMVVLNHGWAQRILSYNLYARDARAIALSLSALLAGVGHNCPVNEVGDEFADV